MVHVHRYFVQFCLLLIATCHLSVGQIGSPDSGVIDPSIIQCPQGQICCNGYCCYSWTVCNPPGVKPGCYYAMQSLISASPTTSACKTCAPLTLNITADDGLMELYIDGVPVNPIPPPVIGWGAAKSIPIPAETKVVAVKSNDTAQVVASNLASIGYNYFLTDSSWQCSAVYTAGWMNPVPPASVAAWPSAVANELNPGTPFIHSAVAGISPLASWIWTRNSGYGGSSIDPVVYCRGVTPSNSCNLDTGFDKSCGNLCADEGKTCCNCRMLNDGPTKVCSCCPAGYKCCGPSTPRMTYGCCREDAECSKDGLRCIKTSYTAATLLSKCGISPA